MLLWRMDRSLAALMSESNTPAVVGNIHQMTAVCRLVHAILIVNVGARLVQELRLNSWPGRQT